MFSLKMPLLMPRGFSANLVLLLWYLFGGVLLWAFEDNILALMFKQVFEDPVDTAQEVMNRGLIPFVYYTDRQIVDVMARSDDKLYQDLASITVIPKGELEFWYLMRDGVHGSETHVYLGARIWGYMLKWGNLYHISKEVLEGRLNYNFWIENKHFRLSQQLAKHLLIFQQVCGIKY